MKHFLVRSGFWDRWIRKESGDGQNQPSSLAHNATNTMTMTTTTTSKSATTTKESSDDDTKSIGSDDFRSVQEDAVVSDTIFSSRIFGHSREEVSKQVSKRTASSTTAFDNPTFYRGLSSFEAIHARYVERRASAKGLVALRASSQDIVNGKKEP